MNDENMMFYSVEDKKFFKSPDEYNEFRAQKAEEKRQQEILKAEKESRKKEITDVVDKLNKLIKAYNTDYHTSEGYFYTPYSIFFDDIILNSNQFRKLSDALKSVLPLYPMN
jgi:hypothetical protein